MSHEGIRIISQAEAEREAAAAATRGPRLGGAAIQPAKVTVDRTGGTGMRIDWKDGATSQWSFPWLRAACPCATCHEAREAEGLAPGEMKPKPASLLPMFEAPPRPVNVEAVGRYALRFTWNDGHQAGLYSWDYLRNVCGGGRVGSE